MRKADGFSLIELLIVVAIILVIAAIAIPRFLESRMRANEASAVESVRTIHSSQTIYATTYPTLGYADTLSKLATPAPGAPLTPAAAGLIDTVLACAAQPCGKSGYQFSVAAGGGPPIVAYTVNAVPVIVGSTGNRGFCSDQTGVITYDPNGGNVCTQNLQ